MLKYDDRTKLVGSRIKEERQRMGLKPKEFLVEIYKSEQSHKMLTEWETGKRMPDLDSLARMAELFDCDIGYLLGDYDEHHRDTADIKKDTGLSEFAIERLKSMWSHIQRDHKNGWIGTPEEGEIKAINTLLECGLSVLDNIHDYLYAQYDSFSLLYGERDDQEVFNKEVRLCNNYSSSGGIYIRAKQMQSVFLLEIQNDLMELRNLIQGTPQKSNAKKAPKKSESKGMSKNG